LRCLQAKLEIRVVRFARSLVGDVNLRDGCSDLSITNLAVRGLKSGDGLRSGLLQRFAQVLRLSTGHSAGGPSQNGRRRRLVFGRYSFGLPDSRQGSSSCQIPCTFHFFLVWLLAAFAWRSPLARLGQLLPILCRGGVIPGLGLDARGSAQIWVCGLSVRDFWVLINVLIRGRLSVGGWTLCH
jgi:hypothetical protein